MTANPMRESEESILVETIWRSLQLFQLRNRLRAALLVPVVMATIAAPGGCVPSHTALPRSGQRHEIVSSTPPSEQTEMTALDVDFEVGPGNEGVLVTGGDYAESYSLEVRDGRVVWLYSCVLLDRTVMKASDRLPQGRVHVRYEFGPEQPAVYGKHRKGKLFINGKLVSDESTMVMNQGSPDLPSCGFTYTGKIQRVVVRDSELEAR